MTFTRLALVLVMVAAHQAHAERIKVAVVLSVAVNVDAARVDALSQDLATALTNELDVDAAGGVDVRRKLPANLLPPDCVTTPSCAAEVARRTEATQLLFLVIVDSGAAIRIETTWIEPATGRLASRPAIELASSAPSEVAAKFAAAAHELLPDAPARPAIVAVVPAPALPVQPVANGERRHLATKTLIVGGVAVLALGVAVVSSLDTVSKYHACDRDPTCVDTDPRRGTIRKLGYVADTSFAIAGGAAILTLVLYATSREARHLVVVPAPDGVAIAAIGRF